MLTTCKTAQERWGGVHRLIDCWLGSRQALIVQYCNLSSGKPLSAESPLADTLSRFCESLMDYCSHSHFEVYDQLIAEAREYGDDNGIELANSIVPKLDELTSRCVDFNDTYDEHCTFDMLAKLPEDLSGIGELLEERFELEDQLIAKLHNIHQQPAEAV